MMNNLVSKIGAMASSLMLATNLTYAEPDVPKVKETLKIIYPIMVKLSKNPNDSAAKKDLLNAQNQITDFFGQGAEGQHSYDYPYEINGEEKISRKTFEVDCDSATISFDPKKGWQAVASAAFTSPLHGSLSLMGDTTVEADMTKFAEGNFIPLTDEAASGYARHIFSMPKPSGGTYLSTHKIPFSLTEEMIKTHCVDGLRQANKNTQKAINELAAEGYFDTLDNN